MSRGLSLVKQYRKAVGVLSSKTPCTPMAAFRQKGWCQLHCRATHITRQSWYCSSLVQVACGTKGGWLILQAWCLSLNKSTVLLTCLTSLTTSPFLTMSSVCFFLSQIHLVFDLVFDYPIYPQPHLILGPVILTCLLWNQIPSRS